MFRKTCEMVSPGHPDKFCDMIADAVVIDAMQHDPKSHVAIEVMATAGNIIVSGEVSSTHSIDYIALVNSIIEEVGYRPVDLGVNSLDDLNIMINVHEQSPNIAAKVNQEKTGAGDQGIIYGHASDESIYLLDLPCAIANDIMGYLWNIYKKGTFVHLRPDMKCQVTCVYDDNGYPKEVDTIVLSVQHDAIWETMAEDITNELFGFLGNTATWREYLTENTRLVMNKPGDFVLGGPAADTGVTGRKLACDTYGGLCCHGGGALSGKDPTKVDRTAAYYSRYIAKALVASGAMSSCTVSVAYVIGESQPISVDVAGSVVPGYEPVIEAILDTADFSVQAMIDKMYDMENFMVPSMFSHFYLPPTMAAWEDIDWAIDLADQIIPPVEETETETGEGDNG